MARVRRARPELDARAVIAALQSSVCRATGYAGSCVFHGRRAARWTASLRSDVCNSYFCSGLGRFVTSSEIPTGAIVIATQDGETRMSPVLTA